MASAASADDTPGTFTVASLNIAGQANVAEALADWTRRRAIDILLLQEVGHRSIDGKAFITGLSDRLGFHSAYAPHDVLAGTNTQGLAIVSRHALNDVRVQPLDYHRLRFRSRHRIALSATAITRDGPLRVVNVHLDTRINSKDRVAQLSPVVDAANNVEGPQIIGGDFNTMNVGWFRTMWPFRHMESQSSGVVELLNAGGFQTPFVDGPPTLRFLGLPFRLDWLFLKSLEPVEWNVDPMWFSDHRGVWARVASCDTAS